MPGLDSGTILLTPHAIATAPQGFVGAVAYEIRCRALNPMERSSGRSIQTRIHADSHDCIGCRAIPMPDSCESSRSLSCSVGGQGQRVDLTALRLCRGRCTASKSTRRYAPYASKGPSAKPLSTWPRLSTEQRDADEDRNVGTLPSSASGRTDAVCAKPSPSGSRIVSA